MRTRSVPLLVTLALLASAAPAGAGHATMSIVSLSSDGEQGNDGSGVSDLSADGRFVVFTSSASNLVPGGAGGRTAVFVRDRAEGVTERVAEGPARHGRISDDGRLVAFISDAPLVAGDDDGSPDVFVRDRDTSSVVRVTPAGYAPWQVAMSGDGRVVAFTGSGTPAGRRGDTVYVWDGGSVAPLGAPGDLPGAGVWQPALSFDGSRVAVASSVDLSGDQRGPGVFVLDRAEGTVVRASFDEHGVPASFAGSPSLSASGEVVAYSAARCAVLGGCWFSVLVTDLATGRTERVDADARGNSLADLASDPSISGDGRYVAWLGHFGGGGTDHHGVFVRDRVAGGAIGINGRGDPLFQYPVISSDGSTVGFTYGPDDLVEGDANGMPDAVVWSPCPLGTRWDGPASGAVRREVSPRAGDQSFLLDATACDVLAPSGL